MDIQKTVSTLCAANGPSGFEAPAAKVAAALLAPLMDEVSIDRRGNVIGVRRCGRENAKRLLLDAHLDEIGLLVTGVEEGFLRFQAIGGVDARLLVNREVTVLTDPPRFGVVACLPPHLQAAADHDKPLPIEELFIDVGMGQEAAVAAIPVGTPMVFRGGCLPLGEQQIFGKALDDRACFAILLRTAELLRDQALDVDLYLMGSTCEECGTYGAAVGTYGINPDFAVAVDVTFAQTPDVSKDKSHKLGGGPVVGLGPNMNRGLSQRLIDKAKELDMPYQIEVMTGRSGTNAWAIQVAREGVATAILSPPLKYMHSPIEVLSLDDMEKTAELLAAFTQGIGEEAAVCWKP